MPTVSVIVPNYNHAAYLRGRIDSILQQTYTDFELILLDDCSTDNSREILETYRTHRAVSYIIYNDVNSGTTFKQWNKGVGLAKGTFIWIAESDDYSEPGFLAEAVRQMFTYPSAGIVFAHSLEEEQETKRSFLSFANHPRFGQAFLTSYFNAGRKEITEKMVHQNTIPNASAVLFKKATFLECGGADENMRLCGDWFLWTKMLLISDVYFIAVPFNHFRLTLASVRNKYNVRNSLKEKLKVLELIKNGGLKKEAAQAELLLLKQFFNSYKLKEWKKAVELVKAHRLDHPYKKMVQVFFMSVYDRVIHRKDLLVKAVTPKNKERNLANINS